MQKCVLDDQLAPRTGQIGDDAADDGRRPARIAEQTHCRGCQAGNGCCNPEADYADLSWRKTRGDQAPLE